MVSMQTKTQPDEGTLSPNQAAHRLPVTDASVDAEIAGGDAIGLVELSRQQHAAPSTCFRWARKGLPDGHGGRVFLEAVRRGKKWLTSAAAVARFFARLEHTQAAPPPPSFRTPAKRERDSARAEKALTDKYGR